MKNSILTGLLAAAIMIGGTVQGSADGHGKGHRMGAVPSFEELDTNNNGRIEQAELAAHQKARFDRVDTDGDGVLSRDELAARMQGRMADRLDRMMGRADADGDGMLSMAEMRNMGRGRMMARADTDGDGAISAAEFKAAQDRLKARSQQRIDGDEG